MTKELDGSFDSGPGSMARLAPFCWWGWLILLLSALAPCSTGLNRESGVSGEARGGGGGSMEECSSFTECLSLANLRVRTKTKHDKRAAATLFERAARMRPGSKQAWLGLGACLQELEDLDGAQEALTNAMAIDPMCWRVGVNIGHLAALRGNYSLSARAFEHIIRSRPNTPPALYSLGFLRMLEGRLDDACSLFEEAWGLKADMHTLEGMSVAVQGLASLRGMGKACPGVVPDETGPRSEALAGGTEWEAGYMSGFMLPCKPLQVVLFAGGGVSSSRIRNHDGNRRGKGREKERDDREGMEELREAVGSLHRVFGAHCDGQVAISVVVGPGFGGKERSEAGAWDLAELVTASQDMSDLSPSLSLEAAVAEACRHAKGDDLVVMGSRTRAVGEGALRDLISAARDHPSGRAGARSGEMRPFDALGVYRANGCKNTGLGPAVVGDAGGSGFLRVGDHADVVVIGAGAPAGAIARVIKQGRMRVTLLNGDDGYSDDSYDDGDDSDDDVDGDVDDESQRAAVYTAVQSSKVVVVVGGQGEDGEVGDGGVGVGKGGRGGGASAGAGGDDELLAKLVKYGSGSLAGGLRRGTNGALRAVFFVCVDDYEPSKNVLEGVGRADWYRLASPISASVSMEGDAGAPSGQDALPLVEALGLLLWPAGERDRVPAHHCHLRLRPLPTPPTPDTDPSLHIPTQKPRICLCVPTLSPPSVNDVRDLPLAGILVPSLVTSVAGVQAGGFAFVVYVGYDLGDPLFDSRGGEVWGYLDSITNGSGVHIHPFKLPPTRGGIAFIWNALMRAAHEDGCEYMYQSNDDVEFVTPGWPRRFVDVLKGSSVAPNFGIVGATDLNNPIVMTQSFVHRTHIDILGSHFPHTIKNWHLDDWSSTVYGPDATFHLKDVHIRNTNSFGTRYSECREDERWFRNEVRKQGGVILKWREDKAHQYR